MSSNENQPNDECDYLVIGAGATGMAFCDTLLHHSTTTKPKVILIDRNESPGGHWKNGTYQFCQLHQPSNMYGVESKVLEPSSDKNQHRATQAELVDYYQRVQTELEQSFDNFQFWGNVEFDLMQFRNEQQTIYTIKDISTGTIRQIKVNKRVVDARNLEPDVPLLTPPKFEYDSTNIKVIPVNDLMNNDEASTTQKNFVVIGGGKTGMDAVYYLLTHKKVAPEHILWIVPHDAWITAREHIGNCMQLLYTCCQQLESSSMKDDVLQQGFLQWEQEGHVYRLDTQILPTKFKDATLSREELQALRQVKSILRGHRITKIHNNGDLELDHGTIVPAPFSSDSTTYVHCSAGAFHYTNRQTNKIFHHRHLVIQDVYGTPGFCFVGSLMGKLESMPDLTDDERNAITLFPPAGPVSDAPVSGGDILGPLQKDSGLVQRAYNLKQWLSRPELRNWMFQNRLFHWTHHCPNGAEEVEKKVDFILKVLKQNGIALE